MVGLPPRQKITKSNTKTYSGLLRIPTFKERLEYLWLYGVVSKETFGFDRYLNQRLYTSAEWKKLRNLAIARDNGCDLAVPGYTIQGPIYIHHIEPITKDDLVSENYEKIFSLENLVCCSKHAHDTIHYGHQNYDKSPYDLCEREENDTTPWKK